MDFQVEDIARSVISKVGQLIRTHMGALSASSIQTKGPSDFVTEIDMRSEALILEAIRTHFPDHRILSEESSHGRLENGIFWVVDPLDGTTNFIHGFPFVAVSIAVCENKKPFLGLVLDPIRDELFVARRGGGAYLNDKPIKARNEAPLDQALIATGFPFRSKEFLNPYLDTFRSIFERVSGIRRAGAAALDLAYVAAGRVDGFWEIGLAPWDVAAGSLLVEEAGGRVEDFWGTENYLTNGHIVAGTTQIHPFLLEQVKTFLTPALEQRRAF